MKVQASIRALYAEQQQANDRLKHEVDQLLRPLASRRNWHYESRLKGELSVALKLESGRVSKPQSIEDFFACTLVVRNLSEIAEAEAEIRQRFNVSERRPKHAGRTHKSPDAFPFDDLRLYARWIDDPGLPETGFRDIRFEVQIKTFLQHAWGIATHDLIYKTDDVSWSRQRIAYQIKAMLEHAEISIQEADRLAETRTLAKTQQDTDELKKIIDVLKINWPQELLPDDLRRLADNTRTVMKVCNLDIRDLVSAIDAEKIRQNGSLPVNLSPYSTIVQAFLWHQADAMRTGLADNRKREKVFLTEEIELPEWAKSVALRNVVR